MSAICAIVGEADPQILRRMLEAVPYRGDTVDTAQGPGIQLGYRWWKGRPGKAPGIHRAADGGLCAAAGTLAPAVPDPAKELHERLQIERWERLDGAFAAASWDGRALTLIRDPFGVRSLFTARAGDLWLVATEIKQILATGLVPKELDLRAIHKYLAFSFVPGEAMPILGVRRVLPGTVLTLGGEARPWFELSEREDAALTEQGAAARELRRLGARAVKKRLNEGKVGLALSGGIDSSAVGVWLAEAGAEVHAFTLDFGAASVEREQAEQVAAALAFPLQRVEAGGDKVAAILEDMATKLDLPFGDPVVGPHYLLARAAREAGLSCVFNGEGGDQLFGGWTSKPMVAAAIYGGVEDEDESPEEQYLHAFHRFYGMEDRFYSPELKAAVGPPGQRRAILAPYLEKEGFASFLNRVRLTDLSLKGSQNILPRVERLNNAFGLDLRVPLFDRRLAETAFRIPPALKLHGATEKYVLKLAMQGRLPEEILWRRKFGMSVPVTDWILGPAGGPPGPLMPVARELLSESAVRRRGLLRPEAVAALLAGEGRPSETRRRRLGERIWALMALELYLRAVVGVP